LNGRLINTTFGRRIIMQRTSVALSLTAALVTIASTARSQTSIALDSIITRIAVEAQERSQLYPLAQTLMDSIGPRLAGSIEQRRANEWVLGTYRRWGIPVREERYGTWNEWRREIAHIDLIAPRKRPLEGMLSTWSQGTNGTIEASLVVQPAVLDAPELEAWLPQVRGKLVLLDFPWPSCRPDSELSRSRGCSRSATRRSTHGTPHGVDRACAARRSRDGSARRGRSAS